MKKNNKSVWLCLAFLLASCAGGNDNVNSSVADSSDESSISWSSTEGLYTRLTKAIASLGTSSFTCTGTLGYYWGDSDTTYYDEEYNVEIEVSNDAYYYAEKDQLTDEILYVQNYFRHGASQFGYRSLDFVNNEIVEYVDKLTKYDTAMYNAIQDLPVKKLKGIKGQPDWYNVNDLDIAASFITFLTGYKVYASSYDYEDEGLAVSQLALHFDGDAFDSAYILVENEDDELESSTEVEQYCFELDFSNYGETTPKELTAFTEDDTTANLKEAFAKLKDVKNYTMHFDVNFDSKKIANKSFDYYCDFENNMMFSSENRKGSIPVETTDGEGNTSKKYESRNYNIGVKYKDDVSMLYYFDNDTKTKLYGETFKQYFGSTDYTVDLIMPTIGAVGAGCYKPLGNNKFSTYPYRVRTYTTLADLALYALLPYFEWSSSADLKVEVDADKNLTITVNQSVYAQISDTSYETTDAETTVTINNINSTTIPDCLLNA